MKMIFFSYPNYIKNNYAIINCKAYLDFKNKKIYYDKINELSNQYRIVFLEPEVFILKNQNYYRFEKWPNIKNFLNNLPNNCFFSLDYPSDMNQKYTYQFIIKTLHNIKKYNYSYHYINTVQSRFMDFNSFKYYFNKINKIKSNSKIIGIGNLCRLIYKTIKEKEFIIKIFNYINNNISENYNWIHIYGLSLRHLNLFNQILKDKIEILSFDSTKWTKPCSNNLKKKYGLNCTQSNRQEFFNEYINIIKSKNINLKF